MAKIAQTRFPDPPEQYEPRAFSELVRQLEQIVLQLNSSYQEDNRNEILRRVNFLQGDGAGQGGIDLSDLSVSTGSASGGGSLAYNNTTGVFSFVPASVPAAVDNTPAFEAVLTSDQAISDNTLTKINFNTVALDTDSKYSTTDYRFTPGVAGKYFVYSQINGFSGGDSDLVTITSQIRKNGSVVRFSFVEPSNNFGKTQTLNCSSILTLNTTDYVEIFASIDGNSSGGEVIQGTTNSGTIFGAYKIIGA